MRDKKDYIKESESGVLNRYYVYIHRRKSNGNIFYVGKGTGDRAWVKRGRTSWWLSIEKKYGVEVDVVYDSLTNEEANNKEISIITTLKSFGVSLCNVTKGGSADDVAISRLNNRRVNTTKYRFLNIKTYDVVRATKKEMCRLKNIPYRQINRFWQNGRVGNAIHGWVLLGENESIPHRLRVFEQSGSHCSTRQVVSRFQNTVNGEIFVGTRRELADRYKLDLIQLASLFKKNPRPSSQGWCLVDENNQPLHLPRTGKNKDSLYTFKHTDGKSFCGTRQQFAKYVGVKHTTRLFQATPKLIRGWKVTGIINDYRT